MLKRALGLLVLTWILPSAPAHEVRPAYLELREVESGIYDVLWKVPARGDNLRLALYVTFPEDARVVGETRAMFAGDAHVERWRVQRPGGLGGQSVVIDGLAATKVDALVRLTDLEGVTVTAHASPDAPRVTLPARSSSWNVAGAYLVLGVEHILLGIDHLLLVLALVMLVQGWKRLVATITTFTVAHSLTLAAATLGFVNVPGPPVEACIALSIVFVAAEILHARAGRPGSMQRAPWTVAFAFGLLHGLGFAGALSDVGLPADAIPLALLFFNVGVEAGQLLFIAATLGGIAVLRRLPMRWPRWSAALPPYAIGMVAMYWVIERTAGF